MVEGREGQGPGLVAATGEGHGEHELPHRAPFLRAGRRCGAGPALASLHRPVHPEAEAHFLHPARLGGCAVAGRGGSLGRARPASSAKSARGVLGAGVDFGQREGRRAELRGSGKRPTLSLQLHCDPGQGFQLKGEMIFTAQSGWSNSVVY